MDDDYDNDDDGGGFHDNLNDIPTGVEPMGKNHKLTVLNSCIRFFRKLNLCQRGKLHVVHVVVSFG
jgi:hypothetical protein